jgi:predicted amidophosphoribosyltransferase
VELKLCPRCKKPYLAKHEYCPHCPEPYTWDQESYMNLGCLLLMVVPVFLMVLFWILLIFAPFFR